jgi:hypothetical protein
MKSIIRWKFITPGFPIFSILKAHLIRVTFFRGTPICYLLS